MLRKGGLADMVPKHNIYPVSLHRLPFVGHWIFEV